MECGCKEKLDTSKPECILEHLRRGGKHRLAKGKHWTPPKGYVLCGLDNCQFPIPDKTMPNDKSIVKIKDIVRHLKEDPKHRDTTVRFILPILVTAITALFIGLIIVYLMNIEKLANIGPNMVVMNVIITSFVLASAGLSLVSLRVVSRYLRSSIWESIMEKNYPDPDQIRKKERKTDMGIFVTLILVTIAYAVTTIPPLLQVDRPDEPDYQLNIMISAAMLAIAAFLLVLYRYRRGGRSANEEVRTTLSSNEPLMGKVWNYGFNVFPLTSESGSPIATNGTSTEKFRVYSTIYGILAGLAITVGLQAYYEEFINPYFLHTLNPPSDSLQPFLQLLPSFRLIGFFLIAIPLAHSGYIFLSGLTSSSIKFQEFSKEAPALTAIFCICIVQVAFLFFLGNSIAYNCPLDNEDNSRQGICIESAPTIVWTQTSLFIIWLILTSFFAGIGTLFIRWLIKNSRIPTEWILLHVITIGFVITAYLTILPLLYLSEPKTDQQIKEFNSMILQFNCVLLGVLSMRAALDYIIGLKIYFPDIVTADTGEGKTSETNKTVRQAEPRS